VIFFTNKDENLTKAHVKYLESCFINLAISAKRYNLENGTNPQKPLLPRGDKDSMDEFIEQAKGLIGVLGHRILEPLAQINEKPSQGIDEVQQIEKEPLSGTKLYLSIKNITAQSMLTDDGIVVLTGSLASKEVTDSLSSGYKKLREKLISQHVMVDKGDTYVFEKDYLFSNPSPAAAIIVGYSMNGRRRWKNDKGASINFLEGGSNS